MAAALEIGGAEDLQSFFGGFGADEARAEAGHIGIVVLTSETGGCGVVKRGGSHACDFVCSHSDAQPAAADADAEVGSPFSNFRGDCRAEVGIVDSFFAVRAEIVHLVSEGLEQLAKLALKRKPRMVATDRRPCHPLQSICIQRFPSPQIPVFEIAALPATICSMFKKNGNAAIYEKHDDPIVVAAIKVFEASMDTRNPDSFAKALIDFENEVRKDEAAKCATG